MFTIPNLITFARLVSVGFVVWLSCSVRTPGLAAATVLFTVAALSDWADGYIARATGASSALGTFLDPLVDKVLILSALFVFSARGLIPLWLVLLNVVREFAVTGVRHTASSPGRPVGANWMGKLKFVLQAGLVELCYAYLLLASAHRFLPGGRPLLLWATVAVTAVSFAFLAAFFRRHRGELLRRR